MVLSANIWTLGVNVYEVLVERPLFETLTWSKDEILAEMISTFGELPSRWWDSWENRPEISNQDVSSEITSRSLSQRLWDMGRGGTSASCEWDVHGGELDALEELLAAMLTLEPGRRPSAKQLLASEYMVKWALPSWEKQLSRGSVRGANKSRVRDG